MLTPPEKNTQLKLQFNQTGEKINLKQSLKVNLTTQKNQPQYKIKFKNRVDH